MHDFYLFLSGLRVLLGSLMTMGELWDPGLEGRPVLEKMDLMEEIFMNVHRQIRNGQHIQFNSIQSDLNHVEFAQGAVLVPVVSGDFMYLVFPLFFSGLALLFRCRRINLHASIE